MTARADDPRLIAPERLAEWRKWATDCDQFIAQDLLAHIDALAAENAELRARAERSESCARVWKHAAKHLHGQRAFHRTMKKWAAETLRARDGEIETLRARVRHWHDAHDKLATECYWALPAQEENGYDGPGTLPLCIRALAARAERAEARVAQVVEEASRAWELAAHRGAKLRDIRAAATRIAANPTADGARELAALVLGGEER